MKDAFILLALFGLAYIVGHSKLSLPVRLAIEPPDEPKNFMWAIRSLFNTMIECVACFGFWQGLFVSWVGFWAPFGGSWWQIIATGCLVAATNLLMGAWAKLI